MLSAPSEWSFGWLLNIADFKQIRQVCRSKKCMRLDMSGLGSAFCKNLDYRPGSVALSHVTGEGYTIESIV